MQMMPKSSAENQHRSDDGQRYELYRVTNDVQVYFAQECNSYNKLNNS